MDALEWIVERCEGFINWSFQYWYIPLLVIVFLMLKFLGIFRLFGIGI